MTENAKPSSDPSSEISYPAKLADEESSAPSDSTFPSSGGKMKEGINPFWPILFILVLLSGTIVGVVSWFISLDTPPQDNAVIETASIVEPISNPPHTEPLLGPPPEQTSPLDGRKPTSTKAPPVEKEKDTVQVPARPEPDRDTKTLSEPARPSTSPKKENTPRPVQPAVEAAAEPILAGPMLQPPDPPPALVTALAELTKDDSPGSLAVITEFAKAGWPEAQTALGLALLNGQSISQDAKKAVEYFRKAAEQNNPFAQYLLGQAYQQGSGVKTDPIQAMAWFILAASHGHADAVTERDNRLSALSSSDRHSAFIRVGNLGPKVFAGWGHDPKNQTAVWLPSWYRTGSYSLQVDVPAVDGYAHGQGKVMLQASFPGDSDRVFEGYFSRGYYFGDHEREGEFQFLSTNDFLYLLPVSKDRVYRNVAFWVRVDFGVDFAANPCYVATNRKPDLVTVVPKGFTVLDDEATKAIMGEAWRIFLDACPKNFYADLTVVPPAFGFGKNRFGHRIFVPQLATGNFYGKSGETLTVGNFVNHAKQANEEEQRKLAREHEKEERQQKKLQAATAAKTRGTPDIRGIRLGVTLPELHAHLKDESTEWKPRWDPRKPLPPFRQFEQSIRLTDGARVTTHFTSPVHNSVLYAIVYEQDLRAGPEKAKLVADLETKYGEPDDTGAGGIWWSYQLVSRVDEGLGAFMKIHFRTDRQTNKVEYLRLIVNDAGFGSYDERAAFAAERQAKQEAYEAGKSDKPKF